MLFVGLTFVSRLLWYFCETRMLNVHVILG